MACAAGGWLQREAFVHARPVNPHAESTIVKRRTTLGSLGLTLVLVCRSMAAAQTGAELDDVDDPLAPDAPAEAPAEPPAEAPAEPAAPEPGAETAQGEGEAAGEAAAEVEVDAAADIPLPPDEAPAPPPPSASSEDEVIVTGTRIKRSQSFAAAAPVEVIDRKQLEYSGATTMADVVQHLTVAQGQGAAGGSANGPATSVDLRGLGAGATLVLINGRRTNPTGAGLVGAHFADVGVVPLAAVERIEILKAGASAIYGADAVGGVINIITRRNFDGVRLQADANTTQYFDHSDYTGSAAFGATSDRSRLLLSTSYNRRSELTAGEREFTEGKLISTQGFPGSFLVGAMPMPDPNCEMAEGSMIRPGTTLAPVCGFDYRDYTSLFGNQERINAMGTAEYDLTDHVTLVGELLVARFRGDTVTSPALPIPPPFPPVPADHVDNITFPGQMSPVQVGFIGRPRGREAGFPRNNTSDDAFRGVLGFKGDFAGVGEGSIFESWDWELYTMMGISRYRATTFDTLRQPFLDALNSCSGPDLSGCFNPFYSSINGTGTPNSQAVIDSFSGEQVVLADHALQTYNAGMAGELFELPGGAVGIAFGGELRHEWRSSALDHQSNELQYAFLLGNDDGSAERDVYSGYLELRWPFYDGIELQTAGRAERYTDIDETAISPTVGLTLTPSEIAGRENTPSALRRLQLRGHVARAFRAPTIFQSFPGFAIVPSLFTLQGQAVPSFVPVQSFGNPDLDAETAIALSGGLAWSPIDEISLVGDFWYYDYEDRIAPESARQKVDVWEEDPTNPPEGIILTDDGQLSRVQVKQINNEGHTRTSGIDFGVMFNLTGATFGGGRDDWGMISLGAQGTYTLSFEVPRILIPDAAIEAGAYECDGPNPDDSCDVLGHRNSPNTAWPPFVAHWRVNFPLTYGYEGHTASVIGHYMSPLDDDIDTGRMGDFTEEIDAFFTLDVMYGYTLKEFIGEELTLRVGVYNVLDQDPPLVFTALDGFEPEAHDPRGRIFYGKLISVF
jgi:iron complex outermembrane receptor protein